MSLNLPTSAKEVSQRMKTDLQNNLPVSNPFLPNSLIGALVDSFAGRIYDFYLQLQAAILEAFPDTADGIYLERWGSWVGITRNPETPATGVITVTGTLATSVPVNTVFQSTTGNQYISQDLGTISLNSNNVTLLVSVGQLATATTAGDHNFGSGQTVTILGALQPEYNGQFSIIVISPTQFQYNIVGTPLSPATGTITANALMGVVTVRSSEFGSAQNLPSGDHLTVTTPISGLNSTAYTQFTGVGGGTDTEDDASYRARIQFRYQNPVSLFNDTAIELQAKTVSGVTRVWVYDITPGVGYVTIYFTRDNDPSPIPGAPQIAEVKAAILQIKTAVSSDDAIIVDAPTPIVVNFEFSSLVPNTQTMQNAITANLEAFFADSTSVGVDLTEDGYRCPIFNTIDPSTGESVQSFTLIEPIGTVIVGPNELPILGNITYP